MRLVFRAVDSHGNLSPHVAQEIGRVGFDPSSLARGLSRFAELPRDRGDNEMEYGICLDIGGPDQLVCRGIILLHIGAEREGRFEITERAWISGDGVRDEVATRLPFARQGEPKTILSTELWVVRIDREGTSANCQSGIDIPTEEKRKHFGL
ncbi:hypothetical protein ABIA24_005418 [Sinorhizobium fredii]